MNKPKEPTRLIIFICILALGIWDLFCVVFNTKFWTISEVMVDLGMTNPFIAFVLGLVVGHVFPTEARNKPQTSEG